MKPTCSACSRTSSFRTTKGVDRFLALIESECRRLASDQEVRDARAANGTETIPFADEAAAGRRRCLFYGKPGGRWCGKSCTFLHEDGEGKGKGKDKNGEGKGKKGKETGTGKLRTITLNLRPQPSLSPNLNLNPSPRSTATRGASWPGGAPTPSTGVRPRRKQQQQRTWRKVHKDQASPTRIPIARMHTVLQATKGQKSPNIHKRDLSLR